MSPDTTGASPPAREPAPHDQNPVKSTDPYSPATVTRDLAPVVELAAHREMHSWVAAVEYLNARGLAAAVPASLVPFMHRRGVAVWPVAARSVA